MEGGKGEGEVEIREDGEKEEMKIETAETLG
jgi:hypothetical protein